MEEELLTLKAIYEDDLIVRDLEDGKEIETTIYPATADDQSMKYVCVTIIITIPFAYPESPPIVKFARPRGLSDKFLHELKLSMNSRIAEQSGEALLFDLLDLARDNLTNNNIPHGLCPICLCGFEAGNNFQKTECFHHFHLHCLKDYKNHLQSENSSKNDSLSNSLNVLTLDECTISLPCPICKMSISLELAKIDAAIPPKEEEDLVDLEYFKKQKEMFDAVLKAQKEKGGLIDLDQERNKYLLSNLQQNYDIQKAASNDIRESPSDNLSSPSSNNSRIMNHPGSSSMEKKYYHKRSNDNSQNPRSNRSKNYRYSRGRRPWTHRHQNSRSSEHSNDSFTSNGSCNFSSHKERESANESSNSKSSPNNSRQVNAKQGRAYRGRGSRPAGRRNHQMGYRSSMKPSDA